LNLRNTLHPNLVHYGFKFSPSHRRGAEVVRSPAQVRRAAKLKSWQDRR
jgi:hypothetical protein